MEFSQQIFIEFHRDLFCGNTSSGGRVDTCSHKDRQTEDYDEVKTSFFWEHPRKNEDFIDTAVKTGNHAQRS
jgi:hypothetical protein